MTKNQIEYAKVLEQNRANLAQEALTRERDKATKDLGYANLSETTRSHKATEAHNYAVLGESNRHNIATEQHAVAVLGEEQRKNRAQEAHNSAVLAETAKHNRNYEQIQMYNATEQHRSNVAREAETNRHNTVEEANTRRRDLQNYSVGLTNADIARQNAKTQRDKVEYDNVNTQTKLKEDERHNKETEANVNRYNVEVSRHNRQSEKIQAVATATKGAADIVNTGTNAVNAIGKNGGFNQSQSSGSSTFVNSTGNTLMDDEYLEYTPGVGTKPVRIDLIP